jgi:lactoylglutathione lyase
VTPDPLGPQLFGPMLIVRDFGASVRFYRDGIGLDGDGQLPYAEFVSTQGKLVLLDQSFWATVGGPPIAEASAPGNALVLAIKVVDLEEAVVRLHRHEIAIESPPADRPQMGLRNLLVRDPDGNLVEIYADLKQ